MLSRVESIKMMAIPQFSFLAQALPLPIPGSYFNTQNKIISTFIWNDRKQRINFKGLLRQKEEGGLGVPSLQNYFHATQILTMMKWMKGKTEAKWISIEKEMATILIGTLPFTGKAAWKKHTGQSQCISNTVTNWKPICNCKDKQRMCISQKNGTRP